MAQVAEEKSDYAIVTSDNPRSESPHQICADIASGFQSSYFSIVVDRRQAIAHAIKMATPKDLILIAGKGHETYQLFSHQTIPFDDRKIVQDLVREVSL